MKLNRFLNRKKEQRLNGNEIDLEWIIEEGLIKLVVHSDTESLDKVKECFDKINNDLMSTLRAQQYNGLMYQ